MAWKEDVVVLQGGLDLITPALRKAPGSLIGGQNYEPVHEGYQRVDGYERFDGQVKPSDALPVYSLDYDTGTTSPVAGDILTGATSGALAVVYDFSVDSGSFGGGDAAGTLYLRNVTGTFVDTENLQVSAVTICVAAGDPAQQEYIDDDARAIEEAAAIAQARASIAAVTGSGQVRGLFTYNGDEYAFRDNAGATACVMHKATTAGWVAQTFGDTLDFTAGTAEFLEGETATGGTSGATATIERVVRTSGSWGSTAAGYLVLSGTTGTFSAAETITSASGSATGSGAQVAITLPAGGTYRAIRHNFYGTANLRRAYIVNGTGRAFEWDGSVAAPIRTGLSDALDKPKFVGIRKNHLFLGYSGGSLIYSGTGEPLSFEALVGAGEIGFGEDLTGLVSDTKDALIVMGRNKVSYVIGNDSNDFELKHLSEESGAIADTLQVIGKPVFMDDQGLRDLTAVQSFGDWKMATISRRITPLINLYRKSGKTIVGSMRCRAKDQYRLFYNDGTGITAYFGRKDQEFIPFKLQFNPTTLLSAEDSEGNEILLAGADDGFVYEIDSGMSADGAEIDAHIRLSFMNQGMPNRNKRYHDATVELFTTASVGTVSAVADFSYGDEELVSLLEREFSVNGQGGFWDEAFWDQFYWSAPVEGSFDVETDGIGKNISYVLASQQDDEEPHIFSSITVRYSLRRSLR